MQASFFYKDNVHIDSELYFNDIFTVYTLRFFRILIVIFILTQNKLEKIK